MVIKEEDIIESAITVINTKQCITYYLTLKVDFVKRAYPLFHIQYDKSLTSTLLSLRERPLRTPCCLSSHNY